jgi:hypothetical protein
MLNLNALIERAKSLIMQPGETWDVIAAEETDIVTLYKTWIAPLAAVWPIAAFIGTSIVGVGGLGVVSARAPFFSGLASGLLLFILLLASVYVLALVIDALAPSFGAEKNFAQAFKVAAYAPTATWLAFIIWLIPALAALSLAGLYSLYLLYVGLPKLMKPAEDKAMGYTIAVAVVAAVLILVTYSVTAPLRAPAFRIHAAAVTNEHVVDRPYERLVENANVRENVRRNVVVKD